MIHLINDKSFAFNKLIKKFKHTTFSLEDNDVEGWIFEQGGDDDNGKDFSF